MASRDSIDWVEEIETLDGWSFGDNPEMADRLGRLVVEGKKTATTSLLKAYKDENEPLPEVGQRSFIKDSKGAPLCVVRPTKVEVLPFKDVSAEFARDEGEGDLSLDYWRKAHRNFFLKYASDFTENDEVVCETFEVLHTF